jgi:hypothetical protein
MGALRNAYKMLFEKSEKKRSLGRPKRRWEDNIRMDCREIRWEVVDWMHLTRDRDQWQALVNTIINLRIP